MEIWELIARERVRDTLARYNWSGDAGRIDDLVQTFCVDGELEIRGLVKLRGRDAIAEFLRSVAADDRNALERRTKRVVRHSLTNTRFADMTPESVSVASYFTVISEIGLDHCGRYGDVFVPVGDDWLIRSRFVSTDWRNSKSTMAPASALK